MNYEELVNDLRKWLEIRKRFGQFSITPEDVQHKLDELEQKHAN